MKVEVKKLDLFVDGRGWIAEVLKSDDAPHKILKIHFSYSKPGSVRGNHFHKQRIEWLFVTSGKGKILLEDNATQERKELVVSGDSPVLVKISPNTIHAIENCANIPTHLLVIANENPNQVYSDTFPKQIISKQETGNGELGINDVEV